MANLHDGGDKSTKGIFTLSSSRPSARSVSVDPEKTHIYTTETSGFLIPAVEEMPPGRRAVDVYEASLSWWRAAIRRKIVASVRKESVVIARMQVGVHPSPRPHPDHPLGLPSNSVARRLLCLYVFAGNAHILHDCPARSVLLRTL